MTTQSFQKISENVSIVTLPLVYVGKIQRIWMGILCISIKNTLSGLHLKYYYIE